MGWGDVDDAESVAALERAFELGVTFYDTSNVYGCGHSERILGGVFAPRRDKVVIATKFGNIFDEQTRRITGASGEPADIRTACESSLRRLQSDYIDMYHFHIGDYDTARIGEVVETLEQLVTEGKVRWYGWSTDDPERARIFAQGAHCAAIQQRFNLFEGNEATLKVCEDQDLASINRGPLAMGLLTGKFDRTSRLPENDVRSGWDFKSGEEAQRLRTLQGMRNVLTEGGRTLAQGALGWLWARSSVTIPIPGFKTTSQVEENVGATAYGELSETQMASIAEYTVR